MAQVGPMQIQRNGGDIANVPAFQSSLQMGGLSTKSVGVIGRAWDGGSSNVVVADTYVLVPTWPWNGQVLSLDYATGGTTPSFTATLKINGVNVTGCAGIVVTSLTKNTAVCTGNFAYTNGQNLTLVISGVTGTPFDAYVSVNYNVTR